MYGGSNLTEETESDRRFRYTPAADIIRGKDDLRNIYWDSFLPIFFDRMNILMRKAMNQTMERYGLTSAHSYYLIALDVEDGQTQRQLSRFLDMDPANTNRVMKDLLNRGFVRTEPVSPGSKRLLFRLTDEGRKAADDVMAETQDRMNGYMAGIPREEVDDLREKLIKILNNVDPEFLTYVDSPHANPFYTYLSLVPPDDDYTVIGRRRDRDKAAKQRSGAAGEARRVSGFSPGFAQYLYRRWRCQHR